MSEYEREYFDGGAYDIYVDFSLHWNIVQFIKDRTPVNCLDLGGARGYTAKHLSEQGIPSTNLDISKWCYYNRVTKHHVMWDMRNVPYPFTDKQFDLVYSVATMEHIPEEYIDSIIAEIDRISNRSVHGITFVITDEDKDHTHKTGTIKPREWWIDKFHNIAPHHLIEIYDKEDIEFKDPNTNIPTWDNKIKLNLGSFLDMYSYGWKNIDILPLHKQAEFLACRFTQYDVIKKIREDDNAVDCIVASHLLEHLDRKDGVNLLREMYRVLKPGAYIRIATPDTHKLVNKYLDGSISDYGVIDKAVEEANDDVEKLWLMAMAGHKTLYDQNSLINIIESQGFIDVHVSEFNSSRCDIIRDQTFDLHPEVSVYIEARKPGD